jgi:DNA-binding CsgD family transcriptional regulator
MAAAPGWGHWDKALPACAGEGPAPHELGAVLSRAVHSRVPHDCLHLMGMNPGNGVVAFAFWHRLSAQLVRDQMLNSYLGDDRCRPPDLARLRVPAGRGEGGPRTREILATHGLGSELRVLLRDPRGVWGVLALMRESGSPAFTDDDARRAMEATGLMIHTLRTYVTAAPLREPAPGPPPGVIVIGPDQQVRGMTLQAQAWIAGLKMVTPACDLRQIARALAAEVALAARQPCDERDGRRPALLLPATHVGQWLEVHAQALSDQAAGEVAVVVQPARGADLWSVVASWYGITAREKTVICRLGEALSPKQIARRMDVSVHTVNDHLKSVFRKTGTRGRDELLAAIRL